MSLGNRATMTINADGTASVNINQFGVQGEVITVLVNVHEDVVNAAASEEYDGYIDFLLPDGSRVYKGPFNIESESFTMTLGADDEVMNLDGDIFWQFWTGEWNEDERTTLYSTRMYKNRIGKSINAVVPAVAPFVPAGEMPETYPASAVTVSDAAEHFDEASALNAEDVLAYVGETLEDHQEDIEDHETRIAANEFEIEGLRGGWAVILPAPTYVSANSFSMSGDQPGWLKIGMKFLTQQSDLKSFYVLSSSYSAGTGLTTVTVFAGNAYELEDDDMPYSAISAAEAPSLFEHWLDCSEEISFNKIDDGYGGEPEIISAVFKACADEITLRIVLGETYKAGGDQWIGMELLSGLPDHNETAQMPIGRVRYHTLSGDSHVLAHTSRNFLIGLSEAVIDDEDMSDILINITYRYKAESEVA